MNIDQITVTKLSLSPGDVLAVMVPTKMTHEQCDRLLAFLARRLPSGVSSIIFDDGITIAQITAEAKA